VTTLPYWDPGEGSRIDDIDARLASYAQQVERMRPPMADKFLDQLKADVEAAKAADQLAKAQEDDRGKAFLDKITAEVEDAGGKVGK
jgi:hypothetical protein